MTNKQLFIVLISAMVCFATLYTPQPILPDLVAYFGVSESAASMVITATLLPMCVAPLLFGYFLQAIPAKSMLSVGIGLLIVNQVLLYLVTEYWQLIVLRTVQGFILPAIFTSLMTYCATMSSANQPRSILSVMGLYIAATIIGGFSSRLLSGYLTSVYTWQSVFLMMGLLLLIPLFLIRFLDADAKTDFNRLDPKQIQRVLSVPEFRNAYIALMLIFFTFAGVLALLPFRLIAINPNIDSFGVSLLYLGYVAGIPAAVMSSSMSRWFGSVNVTLRVALLLNVTAMGLALLASVEVLFIVMIIMPFGFFLIHSLLSGSLNKLADESQAHHKGVVNGIYVAAYYLSGALGSWMPFYFYEGVGWDATLMIQTGILLLSFRFVLAITRQ